jgi:hypothetical protein
MGGHRRITRLRLVALELGAQHKRVLNAAPVQHDLARHGLHEAGEPPADRAVDRIDGPPDIAQKRQVVMGELGGETGRMRLPQLSGIAPELPEAHQPPGAQKLPTRLENQLSPGRDCRRSVRARMEREGPS